jgi:hypothetical protein
LIYEPQRFAFLKVKVLGFWLLLDWLCLSAAIREATSLGFMRVLTDDFDSSGGSSYCACFRCLAANLDEGVNRADCHVETDAFVKDANYVAICATLAPQLADQFAVSFEFGARRFLRDRIQQGKKGLVHDFQAP